MTNYDIRQEMINLNEELGKEIIKNKFQLSKEMDDHKYDIRKYKNEILTMMRWMYFWVIVSFMCMCFTGLYVSKKIVYNSQQNQKEHIIYSVPQPEKIDTLIVKR